jgi:hypothetical protein
MKEIKRLDINDNHIGIDGAAYIFQMKGVTNLNLKHDSIRALYLSNKHIGDVKLPTLQK